MHTFDPSPDLSPPPGAPDEVTLAAYLGGEGAPQDAALIERWIAADPRHAEYIDGVRQAISVATRPALAADATAFARRIGAIARAEVQESQAGSQSRRSGRGEQARSGRFPLLLGKGTLAAGARLKVEAPQFKAPSVRWEQLRPRSTGDAWRRLAWLVAGSAAAGLVAWGVYTIRLTPDGVRPQGEVRFATVAGQRMTLKLPLLGTITLGPRSLLNVRGHVASLDGIARFELAHHDDIPFVVRTANATMRVLGTDFVVRHDAPGAPTRVAVREGRVALRATTGPREVSLSAGTVGAADDSGMVTTRPATDADDYASTVGDRLVFRDRPLAAVVVELERAYGVEIRVRDSSLGALPVSFTVSTDRQSLTAVLDALAVTLDTHYTRDGHVITIARGAMPHARPRSTTSTMETGYGR